MNHLSNYTKCLLFILLIVLLAGSFFYSNDLKILIVFAISSILVLLLILILFISKLKARNNRRIINEYIRKEAEIIENTIYKSDLILQILVYEPDGNYISSLILRNPTPDERNSIAVGSKIVVYVNPKNKHHIVIPEFQAKSNQWFLRNRKIMLIICSFIAFGSVPFLFDLADNSERSFQDLLYIKNSNNKWNLWELRFEFPSKIYISVYDPFTRMEEFSLVEQKEIKLDERTKLRYFHREHSVFILGTGDTPVLDEYDDRTFRKISDIKSFESKNTFLNQGIARIEKHSVLSKFLKENVFKLITNDGNIRYYNINQNTFYTSKEEVKEYFKKNNSALMSKYMNTFFLARISDSTNGIHQIFSIRATGSKGLNDLMEVAGKENERLGYYLSPYFKHLTIDTIAKETSFYKGKLTYFDFDVVVIQSKKSSAKDSQMQIDGYDKDGNSIFHLNLEDYPNYGKMSSSIKKRYYEDIRRNENLLTIMFKFYGAICIDIKSRKIIWKYEL